MSYRFPMIAGLAFMLGAARAAATDLPNYEVSGFPITPHQVAVIWPVDAEQSPTPAVSTLAGMPASPHQIAVLAGRRRLAEQVSAKAPETVQPVQAAAVEMRR